MVGKGNNNGRCAIRAPSVLIVQGSFGAQYEAAWVRALDELGVDVRFFETHKLTLPWVLGRVERRILAGPGVARIRHSLLRKVKETRPEVTLLYQGHYFDRAFIQQLRNYTFVVGYHNDDPFGERRGMLRYRHFLTALPAYDGFHFYRQCNVEEATSYGVDHVAELKAYYLPWIDYPIELADHDEDRWACDLVFIGHAEPDLRGDCLSRAALAGAHVKIYGNKRRWNPVLPPLPVPKLELNEGVKDEAYRRALCGAKIASCFFSKWNRDQYTRRVFEIPACGVFLLAERTAVMQELFKEGKEAEFFSSSEEFVDKVKFYLANEELRRRVAAAGRTRVVADGHDIHSRMRRWLADIVSWRSASNKDV